MESGFSLSHTAFAEQLLTKPTIAYLTCQSKVQITAYFWQRARWFPGLGDRHVHDLSHTVGMHFREAGVVDLTIADIIWHNRPHITQLLR